MLSVAEVVQRIDAGVAARLPDWNPSAHTWEDFATAADGAQRAHLGYVVAAFTTAPVAGVRRRRDEGILVRTAVGIRFLHRIRAGLRREDYAAALESESTLVQAALGTSGPDELVVTLANLSRRELPASTGGYVLGEVGLSVLHSVDPGGTHGRG